MLKSRCLCLLLLLLSPLTQLADGRRRGLLTLPAICKSQIAFVYAGDLWVSNLEGGEVRRLTTGQTIEIHAGLLSRRYPGGFQCPI